MFWQHCQENKELAFLARIPKQVYAAIWNLQKMTEPPNLLSLYP